MEVDERHWDQSCCSARNMYFLLHNQLHSKGRYDRCRSSYGYVKGYHWPRRKNSSNNVEQSTLWWSTAVGACTQNMYKRRLLTSSANFPTWCMRKEKKCRAFVARGVRRNPMTPTPREGVSLSNTAIPEIGLTYARLARCVYALGLPLGQLTFR